MIEQQARVVNVRGDHLELEAETQSTCSACNIKSGCGTSVLAKWIGRKFTRFDALNTVNARKGDTVIVGLSENALLSGSVAVYLWPLFGMMVFALLSDIILSQDDGYRDQWIALFAISGFALAAWLSRWRLNRDSIKDHLTPVVLRKVIGHGRIPPT